MSVISRSVFRKSSASSSSSSWYDNSPRDLETRTTLLLRGTRFFKDSSVELLGHEIVLLDDPLDNVSNSVQFSVLFNELVGL